MTISRTMIMIIILKDRDDLEVQSHLGRRGCRGFQRRCEARAPRGRLLLVGLLV